MKQTIGAISLLVRDYDETIDFYVGKLDFTLTEDTATENGKRWVLVTPKGSSGTHLLLAKAATPEQVSSIGNQTGGLDVLFLHTDNFPRDYEAMKSKGVQFLEEPRHETYGTVAVFEDLYGNKWDLLETNP